MAVSAGHPLDAAVTAARRRCAGCGSEKPEREFGNYAAPGECSDCDLCVLRRRVNELESSNAALMVDAGRREQRALDRLPDCDAHRDELDHLRRQAREFWQLMTIAEDAISAYIGQLDAIRERVTHHSGPVPVDAVGKWLTGAINAVSKEWHRRPRQASGASREPLPGKNGDPGGDW
jgi:hypothetical protein